MKPVANLGVNIYASKGTLDAHKVSGHRYREIKSQETVTIGTFHVLAFDVVHDAEEPLGFLIESKETGDKLLYFSDTAYIKYTFTGITHIIAECNHGEAELRKSVREGIITADLAKRIAKNHMSLERLVDMILATDRTRLKAVYLVHLSNNNSDAERFKREIQSITGTEVYLH
jgi:phosphoribosyl 1,2-cyclic phosphodiesterase